MRVLRARPLVQLLVQLVVQLGAYSRSWLQRLGAHASLFLLKDFFSSFWCWGSLNYEANEI